MQRSGERRRAESNEPTFRNPVPGLQPQAWLRPLLSTPLCSHSSLWGLPPTLQKSDSSGDSAPKPPPGSQVARCCRVPTVIVCVFYCCERDVRIVQGGRGRLYFPKTAMPGGGSVILMPTLLMLAHRNDSLAESNISFSSLVQNFLFEVWPNFEITLTSENAVCVLK